MLIKKGRSYFLFYLPQNPTLLVKAPVLLHQSVEVLG